MATGDIGEVACAFGWWVKLPLAAVDSVCDGAWGMVELVTELGEPSLA